MNLASIISVLSDITGLSPMFKEELSQKAGEEKYKAHQIIHAAGQMENRLYFIETGFARNYYYDHHGNEHTVKFWKAGDILFSYEGYYNVPSYFYTEILEESNVITLNYAVLHELDDKFPEISLLIKTMLIKYQHEEYEKQKLIALPAEERYLLFRENNPNIFQKAPSRIIASFLHITRETLTRYVGRN
jgi:CRP-like cAMP-binding protein